MNDDIGTFQETLEAIAAHSLEKWLSEKDLGGPKFHALNRANAAVGALTKAQVIMDVARKKFSPENKHGIYYTRQSYMQLLRFAAESLEYFLAEVFPAGEMIKVNGQKCHLFCAVRSLVGKEKDSWSTLWKK